MQNPVTEEMISAYVDGELDASSRQSVEQALQESEQLRQLHCELLEIRAAFGALPHHDLPADFRDRVLHRAAEERPTLVELAPSSARRTDGATGQRAVSFGRWVPAAIVVATVATVLFAVFAMNSLQSVGPIDWTETSLVYYRQDDRPNLTLLVDVTITPRGRANDALESVFKQAGIEFDPDLIVAERLEESILASRMIAKVQVRDDLFGEPQDEVQVVYVVATPDRIDAIYAGICARQRDFFPPQLDLMSQQDHDLMYQVNESSRLEFAGNETGLRPSLAHRLPLRVSLTSIPGMARIPWPKIESALSESPDSPDFKATLADPDRDPSGGEGDRDDRAEEGEISEVLFVLRYLSSAAE